MANSSDNLRDILIKAMVLHDEVIRTNKNLHSLTYKKEGKIIKIKFKCEKDV